MSSALQPTILPILNSALKQEASSETSVSNWLGRNIVDFCLNKIIEYRQGIFYTGIAFSVAAVVAAFFTKMILVILFLGASAGCFSLAAWAFRTRESKMSDTLGQENARLGKAVVTADNTLLEERKNVELLKEKNQELHVLTEAQAVEMGKLRNLNSEHEKQLKILGEVNERLESQNAKLLIVEAWFMKENPEYF